jgi:hypothetical protein
VDPRTAPLAEALEDWIGLLEKDDVRSASIRWSRDAPAATAMARYWGQLEAAHRRFHYRKWLAFARTIGDGRAFTVGGHSFGYVHVDWEKTADGWRIAQVWVCR